MALFALSGGRAHAAVEVQLSPSLNSPQPVGTTVTWTASATDTNPGTLYYQFSVRLSGGDYAVVRDFATANSFEWTPSEREGSFDVRVIARNISTLEEKQLTVSYSVGSRVTGGSPVISGTANPLVALYSAPPCETGSMRVRFWRTGDFTSQSTPWKSCLPGVSRNFYVAGMLAATEYSVRHEVSSDPEAPVTAGPTLPFLTGSLPPGFAPAASVVTPSAGDSGQDVLLHSHLNRSSSPFITATNLSGALIWYYGRRVQNVTRPVEGGTVLVIMDSPGGSLNTLREIDLAGNTVRETGLKAVSDQLVARGANPLTSFHHEARRLPDGRTVVLAGTERVISDVQGPGPVAIVGDMIVVLDEDWQVVWYWDSFDHLDVTRKALLDQKCPQFCVTPSATANDWTHSNAVGYSPFDGSLLLSVRHQDWVVKIDYRDGAGDGTVLWKLGKDGDFTYDSADPYPWFSHQHDADFLPGQPGTISLFDNGNMRQTIPGVTHNSRGQVLNIDEAGRKVTFQLNADLGGYSGALGSAQNLSNGGFHFLSGFLSPPAARSIEARPDGSLAFILQTPGFTYRSFRMRDLYTPGAPGGVDQSISFGAVAAQTYGSTFDLSATASSGLPVSFRVVSGPATLSGDTLTFTGAGTVVVQADQDGNIKYNPARSVRQTFAVNKAEQTITFEALANRTFGDAPFAPVAAASSDLAVSFAAEGQCTFNGGAVNITGAGSCTVTASQGGDANFNAAPSVQRSFTINRAGSTTVVTVADATYDGLPHGGAAAVSGAGGLSQSLTVTYAGRNATVYGPSTVAPTNAGDYTASANFGGDANHTSSSDSENFQITKAGQTVNFNALTNKTFGDPDFTLSATASSGLGVSFSASGQCSVSGNSVHIAGAGSCTVTASQAGDANHNPAAAVARTFQIAKAAQTVTFGALADKTFGDPDFPLSASASSGLAVGFSAGGNCTVSGSTVHITGAGTCTLTASQPGDANYHAATPVARSFNIARALQAITFAALPNKTFGDAPFNVSAAGGGSGNPVTFSSSGSCSAGGTNGSTVTINGAGSCTLTASQAGDGNYSAASSVSRSFSVSKAATTTALSSSSNPSGAGQAVTFTATVTSPAGTPGGLVQFNVNGESLGAPVPLNAGGVASLTTSTLNAGSYTVTADYGGAANFNASSGALGGAQLVGGLFEFSLPLYSVAERGGSITVSVRRTGDASTAASVDYTTDDGSVPPVAVPCSSVTGLALDRCDYTAAAGRLDFAAGEALKTFVVLVNDDSFVEGTETTHLRLSNASVGAALGSLPSATLEITDDTVEPEGNHLDDAAAFVRQHYHDFLNREPDAEGLAFWVGGIESCGPDQQCRAVKRRDTSAAFFLSIEFQETGFLVQRMYKAAYGDATGTAVVNNTPVQIAVPVVRLDEFLRDTQRIARDVVVGTPGWPERLNNNKVAFAQEFVSRTRFANAFGPGVAPAEFVDALDTNAGRVLSAGERQALVDELSANNTPSGRASVLRKVAEDADFAAAESGRAFVLMQYFGYMRRNPNDPQDTDYSGYNFWLRKLEDDGGDFRAAQMVEAFIDSIEYKERFGR